MAGTTTKWVHRPWGRFLTVHEAPGLWVKTIAINPGSQLSLQIHDRRDEFWHGPEGRLHAEINGKHLVLQDDRVYHVPAGVSHRLINPTRYELSVTEVATGDPDEADIIRLADDYGREGLRDDILY